MENKNNEIQCAACGFIGRESEFFNSAVHTKFMICPKCGTVRFLCDNNKEFRCDDQDAEKKRTLINRSSLTNKKDDSISFVPGDKVRSRREVVQGYRYTKDRIYRVEKCMFDLLEIEDDEGNSFLVSADDFDKIEMPEFEEKEKNMKTIHLVDKIKVELNFKGRHLYQEYFGHAPERDNFGLTEMQLLDLINMCGGHLDPGAITPISHNYIYMKDSDLENVNDLY